MFRRAMVLTLMVVATMAVPSSSMLPTSNLTGTGSAAARASLARLVAEIGARLHGADIDGSDISWPQCPKAAGGRGLPLPPAGARFVVVGLTRGRPFTDNPCLDDHAGWALGHLVPSHVYTMAAAPTAAQLTTWGSQGPWPAITDAARRRNSGYAQARSALAATLGAGFSPTMVWLDVESLSSQPWAVGTSQRQVANRDVLTGLMRGLSDAGIAFGIYSYARAWHDITGNWQLLRVPVWATAGRATRAAAVAMCARRSFSGGPVMLAQWYDAVRDSDVTCPPFAFVPAPPARGADLPRGVDA